MHDLQFKKLLDELGPYEIKDEEGYFYGVYEHLDGSLYKGSWVSGEKYGFGIFFWNSFQDVWYIRMVRFLKDNGEKIKQMDKEEWYTVMEIGMKEHG